MQANSGDKSSDSSRSESKSHPSGFLKTDGGKTKSNSIEIPSISLPKGGGAIKGIDEKFSVNAINGTASFSIPLPFSPARGASPSLSLSYNSGAGNSIFGLGWNLSLPSIRRKTDKGLPQYLDAIESDIFLFSGAEDLVPGFKKENDGSFSIDANGDYVINKKDSPDGLFTISFYKPRIEGLFARIERWTEKTTALIKWRIITRDNVTTLFGWSNNSVIADPKESKKIFEWLPEFVFDDKGNCCQYIYKKEDDKGFDSSLLHNRNRFESGNITYTNIYVEKILYGNKTPFKKFGDAFPIEADYLFQTVFDYGTLKKIDPVTKINDWDFRTDSFSDYKSGFEIRTTRLCKRVLLFHHFTGPNEYDGLVKSVNFDYDTASEKDFTFLKSITALGYIKKADGTYTSKHLPATEFEYQKHEWNKDIKVISAEDLVHAPSGLDEQLYQFTDLFNEGLSGILTEQGNGWYYKHNLGEGKFEQAKLVTPKSSFVGLGRQLQLADLDADGGRQLVSYGTEPKGYFELDDDNEWQGFRNFRSLPNIDFGDANTRMLDLNGDGKPEVLITEENIFTWYQSEGRNGFSQAHKTVKLFDEEAGPNIVFADAKQIIFLADMSGDGMTDIVSIRNGEVCYWPNLGYGKFGTKVAMDNAPLFDYPDSFNPAFLRLADIDGSGTPDIIYLGKNKFTCWLNLSGNTFSTVPFEIDAFPDINTLAKITVTDLLGNGVACIVWSSGLSKDTGSPLRYIDLMNSKKPHIMVFYKNNLGKEVSIEYTPSTKYYIDDKLAGKPWITKLHFPVHCISNTETIDKISDWHFVSSYKYHHGYYDHLEREFRGFGMVEQTDAESFEDWVKGDATNVVDKELHQEPVVSKTWTHTGAFLRREKILDQFAHEYWYEEMKRQRFAIVNHEVTLPDAHIIPAPGISNTVIEHLSAQEWREALRACKSMTLRSEIFAHDAPKIAATADEIKRQLTPYTVATHNCVIELLQPKGKNKYAVFIVKESEAITYSYERNTGDPRIAHNLNIKLDKYGNVLESAAVVYPRMLADASLPLETQQEQNKTVIIYTRNKFTNDVLDDDVYRLRLPSEVKTFELKAVSKLNSFYSVSHFDNILDDANSSSAEYHELDKPTVAGKAQKRLIEHVRTNFLKNDLSGALPLHQLESLALPYQNFQLAYTPVLLTDIYSTKANNITLANLMTDGKFSHSIDENGIEDNNWWIRSGTTQFIEAPETVINAQNRFYVPISYTDSYESKTKVKYYSNYFLFIEETEDELKNKSSVDVFNFRTLSPQRMKDMNNNLSEAISDELGLVKAMAVMGKGLQADDLTGLEEITVNEQADIDSFFITGNAPGVCNSDNLRNTARQLLKHATVRFIYDFDTYSKAGKPAVITSIARETHHRKEDGSLNPESKIQISFEYSNGLGKVIMKKMQAEPGKAKQVTVDVNNNILITEPDTTPLLRWIGNGRTFINNKGNAVKQYEPFFSVSPKYEEEKELVEAGVTPLMFYDAMGRLIKTEMPDGTFSKVEFDSWKQKVFDANDTVKDSEWFSKRKALPANDPERKAADKAEEHAGTPNVLHFDTMGRAVLSIDYNKNITTGADEFYRTKIKLDTEGNLRMVNDARELPENGDKGNTVMQYKYDMLGNLVYQNSMDAGQRWMLVNILGNPLRTWDERNHEFQYFYDALHRPLQSKVIGGDGVASLTHLFDKLVYSESLVKQDRTDEAVWQAKNMLGKLFQHYDTAGIITNSQYDFKGNLLQASRQLLEKYDDAAPPDWAKTPVVDPNNIYITTNAFDALNRPWKLTTPDNSVQYHLFNEAGNLEKVLLNHQGAINITAPDETFDALTANAKNLNVFVVNIDYNEKGQRSRIVYGNNSITNYTYDKQTFRLARLTTANQDGNNLYQDLKYTYDPVGNITQVKDDTQQTIFFGNTKVEPVHDYTYDAIYRLIQATGREHVGQNVLQENNQNKNYRNFPFKADNVPKPGDTVAMRNYTQKFTYDAVGNITKLEHKGDDNTGYTRNYFYNNNDTDRATWAIPANIIRNNRLLRTQINNDKIDYDYDLHGNMIVTGVGINKKGMPHLSRMDWNFKDELFATAETVMNNGTPATTFYVYDAEGIRVRKITNAQNSNTKSEERIYLHGFEIYRSYNNDGIIKLERQTLHVMDDKSKIAMVETKTTGTDDTKKDVAYIRYQYSNHLGSACLELNEKLEMISYEEYHPYGTTAFQAMNVEINPVAKRYRYTGLERDDESGFGYHNARYYVPWLGRWITTDPSGIQSGINLFSYTNNPLRFVDKDGRQATDLLAAREKFESLQQKIAENRAIAAPLKKAEQLNAQGKTAEAAVAKAQFEKGYHTSKEKFMNNYLKAIGAFYLITFASAAGGTATGAAFEAVVGEKIATTALGSVINSTLAGAGGSASLEGAQHGLAKIGGYDKDIAGNKFTAETYWKEIKEGAKYGFAFGVLGRLFSPKAPTGGSPKGNPKSATASGVIEAGPGRNPVIPDEPKVIAQFSNTKVEISPEPAKFLSVVKIQVQKITTGILQYVVTADGNLRVGPSRHIDLAQGEELVAAGEVKFRKGQIVKLDNESGSFLPNGEGARYEAEKAFETVGFDAKGKYVQRQR